MSDLQRFATEVRAVAGAMDAKHLSGRKAWIHMVYGSFLSRLDYDAFKSLLWDSANARLLDLVRCDMVEGFNPTHVRRSTLSVNGATFNFIRF